jgi:DNA repair protein RecO (recombination protein O)
VTVIAKGARRSVKRFPGTLDLFNHLLVSIDRRRRNRMGYLEAARLLSPFLGLRDSARRYALASYLLELMDRMAPEDGPRPDTRRIFAFTRAAFGLIAGIDPDRRLRVLVELRALDALGLRPELGRCVRCGRAPGPRAGFHIADGGAICERCAPAGAVGVLPVHLGTLRSLETGLACEIDHLARLHLDSRALGEAEHILFRFQRYHIGMELRSERFLDETLHAGRLTPAPT